MCNHVSTCMSVCASHVMGIITTKSPWLRATAGLVCCPQKWISMGKQTHGAFTYHTLKLHTEIIQAGDPQQCNRFRSHSLYASDTALIWTTREVCSDTTEGLQRAVAGQILRELRREKRERWERESKLTQQIVRRARLAALYFLLLILKSSVIRMRGCEHVAWLMRAETMLGPGRIADWWDNLTGQ